MDRLQAMRVFTRIVELGSFTGAADDLSLPRATLTHTIKRLEERVGAHLPHNRVVDRDNGHDIRRRLDAANQRSQVDRRGFDAVKKSEVTTVVLEKNAEAPDPCQSEGYYGLEMATCHSLLTARDAPSRPPHEPEATASPS